MIREVFGTKEKGPGTAPGPTCPVLFDGLAHFWEYCLVLTLFNDVLLTVPPEVVFDVALILGVIENVVDGAREPETLAFHENSFS